MRAAKILFLLTLLVLLALVFAPLLALYLGTQEYSVVQPAPAAQQHDIARLKVLLREHDPRGLGGGEARRVRMTERDLHIGFGMVNPLGSRQRARVALATGQGVLRYSMRLPANPLGKFFNAALLFSETSGELELESVQFGATEVSGFWFAPLILMLDGQLQARNEDYRDSRNALQSVSLDQGAVDFVYSLSGELFSRIEARGRSLLLPEVDQVRVAAYYHEIAAVSGSVDSPASLTRLLGPLFGLAQERSLAGNAAAENRALLMTLGLVLNGSSVSWLLGDEQGTKMAAPRPVRWSLYGRGDLAQHYGISAALAVSAGGAFANAVGEFKELDDSRGGTGFSFVDLLADRAGVELAGYATGSAAAALQQQLAAPLLREADILPDIRKLPEGLTEMTFQARYRDLDDARYATIKREVDVRIEKLPMYQDLMGRP